MSRRTRSRSRSRAQEQREPRPAAAPRPVPGRRPRRGWPKWLVAGLLILVALAAIAHLGRESPARLRAEAERAARAGDTAGALRAWRAFNATEAARGETHLAEARAALTLGYAPQAEWSLRRAIDTDPADPEPWKLLLEVLWVEDRTLDAQHVVWDSYDRVPAGSRRDVLRALTLALLEDVPDETARTTLKRWIAADPADVDARVALLQRIASQPRAADPDRESRLAELEQLVADHPEHLGAREALATALADAGEPERGRIVLDDWPGPETGRDARYWRLRGRWALEYDRQPDRAEAAFRHALETMSQDWRSWAGLARALTQLGRADDARRAAESVGRIREALEPIALGARLDDDFKRLDDLRALHDLAALASQANLSRLADAWHAEAEAPAAPGQ
jgi:Flp pilus assembly protein TadD